MNDRELIDQFLHGDEAAQKYAEDEIIRWHERLIWSLIIDILAYHEDVWEDAYQEVWLHLWSKLGAWRGGKLSSFLSITAVNRAIDFRRKYFPSETKNPPKEPSTEGQPNEGQPRSRLTFEELPHDGPQDDLALSPLEKIQTEECLRCVKQALMSRSFQERQLLQMVADDLPHAQIRKALGFKQRNFYNVLAEIRRDIQTRCQNCCSE